MSTGDWKSAIERWRSLPPAEQRRIALARLPGKVARSMAFAGEPVDEAMLEAELERLLKAAGLSESRQSSNQP